MKNNVGTAMGIIGMVLMGSALGWWTALSILVFVWGWTMSNEKQEKAE